MRKCLRGYQQFSIEFLYQCNYKENIRFYQGTIWRGSDRTSGRWSISNNFKWATYLKKHASPWYLIFVNKFVQKCRKYFYNAIGVVTLWKTLILQKIGPLMDFRPSNLPCILCCYYIKNQYDSVFNPICRLWVILAPGWKF